MSFKSQLVRVLTISVEKNGADKPLTIGHLLNIIKLADKFEFLESEAEEEMHDKILSEIYTDQCGDRD